MIQVEPFQLTLIILSIISVLWAIRSSFKSYQKEDSIKSAESALVVERISTLNARHESLNQRITEVEKQHTELHVIKSQMTNMHDDMQSLKIKMDSVINILLGKTN